MQGELQSPTKKSETLTKKMSNSFRIAQFQEKQTFLCKFCGGAKCEYEDYTKNTKLPNAINGLHSNWITPDILAMQRLSQRIIKQHAIIEQFHKAGITAVINLQQPGEHADCGDGIVGNSGFSYYPETLYSNNIFFFNLSWEDMTATTAEYMMKIMNIFSDAKKQGGKVAVHCHAGRGRTLLAICSWLIYDREYTAKTVIELAVAKRDGVLSKNSQRQFLYDFQLYLKQRRQSFNSPKKLSFERLVANQQLILLNGIKQKCDGVPLVHHMLMKELHERIHEKINTIDQVVKACEEFNHAIFPKWDAKSEAALAQVKIKADQMLFNLREVSDVRILTQALFDYYDEMLYTQFTTDFCHVVAEEQHHHIPAQAILLSPQLINIAGIHILCVLLSFSDFMSWLMELGASKEQCEWILLRIVKCLMSKKKFSSKSYNGRQLIHSKELNHNENILKKFLWDLTEHRASQSQKVKLQVKIKRVAADMHYHMEVLKFQQKKDIFSKAQMQNIYEKSRHHQHDHHHAHYNKPALTVQIGTPIKAGHKDCQETSTPTPNKSDDKQAASNCQSPCSAPAHLKLQDCQTPL